MLRREAGQVRAHGGARHPASASGGSDALRILAFGSACGTAAVIDSSLSVLGPTGLGGFAHRVASPRPPLLRLNERQMARRRIRQVVFARFVAGHPRRRTGVPCVKTVTLFTIWEHPLHAWIAPHRPRFLLPAFGGGPRPYARRRRRRLRRPRARLRRVPRPRRVPPAPRAAVSPEAPLRALWTGAPRVGRRPAPESRLPRAPHRPAGAGIARAADEPRRARLLATPGPFEAPLGDVACRRAGGRALCRNRQEPPLPDRRRVRSRHHHGHLRPRARPRDPCPSPDLDPEPG